MGKTLHHMLKAGVAGAAAWLYLVKTRMGESREMKLLKRYDYAHRGLHDRGRGIPENSLAAFQEAAAHGYGMELDVHLTRDGEVVVFHDSSLKRMCGADVRIENLTLRELEKYRLDGTQEKIPSLRQVLERIAGKTPLIVEIKPELGNGDLLSLRTAELLDGYDGSFCIESFDPRVLYWFRKNRPDWIRGQLTEYYWKHGNREINSLADFCLHHVLGNVFTRPDFLAYNTLDRKCFTLKVCRRLFGAVEVDWTIRDREQYRKVKEDGALAIFEGFCP